MLTLEEKAAIKDGIEAELSKKYGVETLGLYSNQVYYEELLSRVLTDIYNAEYPG
jgi:hypothetical protein